ncbi:MAG: glycosyl hydrolase, partial [Endomicrobia bacterium]|nr:glycosyl hydrolase [Endomicrobiia bacterium]
AYVASSSADQADGSFYPSLMLAGVNASQSKMDGYSDWSSTLICEDSSDSAKWMKTTIGKGFIFTYNYFSQGVTPSFTISQYTSKNLSFYNSSGTAVAIPGNLQDDRIMIKAVTADRVCYIGVYAPDNATTFHTEPNFGTTYMQVLFSSNVTADSGRYLSVALLASYNISDDNPSEALGIFNTYYNYAYNFITDTKVSYSFDGSKVRTDFNFTLTPKRAGFASGTVVALFPHQWKNIAPGTPPFEHQSFKNLRGTMQVLKGITSFSTENYFHGVLPNLTYEIPDNLKSTLQTYLNTDKNFTAVGINPVTGAPDTYYSGKAVAKAANLIPIFHQFGDLASRNAMIERLKTQLTLWYGGQSSKYFGYDSIWGGIIGVPAAFNSNNYNDHHFHYGYFIYASAILALFDPDFATSSQYKGMVDLLVQDIYCDDRNSAYFPYLRNFDVYEGHSWANGAGGADDSGIDQESSSEAMNAWAGIYLWGVVTGNQKMQALGAYGYTTEYEAVKDYYFDTTGEIFGWTNYAHKSAGILRDNRIEYKVFWEPPYVPTNPVATPQERKGIQILPLTPSMLYLGYDTAYAGNFYNELLSEPTTNANMWKDIWLRFKALFDAAGALADFAAGGFSAEDGSTLSYSYQFINFFNAAGKVDISYRADSLCYGVFKNSGGVNTFIGFNNSPSSYKTITFSGPGGTAGSMLVPPLTYASAKTGNFTALKYDSLYAMYSTSTWYALALAPYQAAAYIEPASSVLQSNALFQYLAPVFKVNNINSATTLYVQASNIAVPAGFDINKAKVLYYDAASQLPDGINIPSQSIVSSAQTGNTASILVKSEITKSGIMLLAIYNGTTVSGRVLLNGKPIDNVKIDVYDEIAGSTQTVVTSGGGIYTAPLIYARTYTVTPRSPEFTFTPQFRTLSSVSAPITNSDFQASIPLERGVIVFPNPYKPSRQGGFGISFSGLRAGAQIRIFNIAGEKIFDASVRSDGVYNWNACNNSGNKVASGVYIYYIDSGGSAYKGKIAIER